MLCLSGLEAYSRWVPLRDQPIYMALDSLWYQDLSIQVHSIQIYINWCAKHNGYEAYACKPETDDCRWHGLIILRESLSVSAANLKYLSIKLRQIYNQRGKAYARKHSKSVDKCLKTWKILDFFSKQQFHPNKSLKLRPKTLLLGFKNEFCI